MWLMKCSREGKEARTVKSGKSEYEKERGLSQCGSPLCRIYRVLRVPDLQVMLRYIRQFECHVFSGCRMLKSSRYAHSFREVFLQTRLPETDLLSEITPYFLSPTSGQPICAICTRIW